MTEPTQGEPQLNIETIKNALRIDGNDDDIMLQGYLNAAEDYVNNAIGAETDYSNDRRFRFAVILLVQFWYSNRTTDMQHTPYQVLSMIQQLRAERS